MTDVPLREFQWGTLTFGILVLSNIKIVNHAGSPNSRT